MLMGKKRPRTPMKRTTSLTELSPDLSAASSPAEIPQLPAADGRRNGKPPPLPASQRCLKKRCSVDPSASEAAPFLTACGLCKRSLGPGFDTFMYRGEVAFCSNECREKQITIDERKTRNKCSSSTTVKKADHPPPPKSSESSASSETIAAA